MQKGGQTKLTHLCNLYKNTQKRLETYAMDSNTVPLVRILAVLLPAYKNRMLLDNFVPYSWQIGFDRRVEPVPNNSQSYQYICHPVSLKRSFTFTD